MKEIAVSYYWKQINLVYERIKFGQTDEGAVALILALLAFVLLALPLNAFPVIVLMDVIYSAINNPGNLYAHGDHNLQLILKGFATVLMPIPIFLPGIRSDWRSLLQLALNRFVPEPKNFNWVRTPFYALIYHIVYHGLVLAFGILAWQFVLKGGRAEITERWHFDLWLFPLLDLFKGLL